MLKDLATVILFYVPPVAQLMTIGSHYSNVRAGIGMDSRGYQMAMIGSACSVTVQTSVIIVADFNPAIVASSLTSIGAQMLHSYFFMLRRATTKALDDHKSAHKDE